MPISDMVEYENTRGGTAGHLGKDYKVKKWHHDIDKPFILSFHKDIKPRHYMDPILKSVKHVPAPNTYNIAKDLTVRQNMMN